MVIADRAHWAIEILLAAWSEVRHEQSIHYPGQTATLLPLTTQLQTCSGGSDRFTLMSGDGTRDSATLPVHASADRLGSRFTLPVEEEGKSRLIVGLLSSVSR